MHHDLLPLSNEVDGLKVKRTIHTHRPESRILRLPISVHLNFTVRCAGRIIRSPALRKAFTYDLKTDSVLIQDIDSAEKQKSRKK